LTRSATAAPLARTRSKVEGRRSNETSERRRRRRRRQAFDLRRLTFDHEPVASTVHHHCVAVLAQIARPGETRGPEMRIRTPLGDLYVEDEGQGPTLLLWHSYLHHGGMWKAQVAALRERYRVINVDAPGHGRSSAVRQPFDMADCVRCVEAVLDARDVERAAMIGLSWGGMVAMATAVRRPERLRGIVVMDANCRREPLGNRLKYYAMGTITREVGAIPLLLDRVEPLFFSKHTREHRRAELVDPWRSYVARLDRESVWHALHAIMDRNDLAAELRRVELPTMVVVGAEDIAQPPRESEHIAASIPGARLVVIPGAAHISAQERPAEVNTVLLEFLSRL